MYFTNGYLSDTFGVSKKLDGYSSLEDSINFFMSDNAKISPTEQELEIRRIEEAKVEQANLASRREADVKRGQLDAQAKERRLDILLQVGLAFGSLVAYDVWYRRGLKFEETGVLRSPWIKNLVSRMFPRK